MERRVLLLLIAMGMVDQDGGLMKPVMRKRSTLQEEVWEWLIKHLPQGELEEVDLPRGERLVCRFCNT